MTSVPLLLARCAALPSTGCCSWAAVLRHGGCVPNVLNGHRSLAGSNLPAASAQAGPPRPRLPWMSAVMLWSAVTHWALQQKGCTAFLQRRAHTRAHLRRLGQLLETIKSHLAPLSSHRSSGIAIEGCYKRGRRAERFWDIYFFQATIKKIDLIWKCLTRERTLSSFERHFKPARNVELRVWRFIKISRTLTSVTDRNQGAIRRARFIVGPFMTP